MRWILGSSQLPSIWNSCVAASISGRRNTNWARKDPSPIAGLMAAAISEAVPALISGADLQSVVLWRDCGMMLALTLLLALFAYAINSVPVITTFEGAVLLLAWAGYNYLLVQQVQGIAV